MNQSNKKKKKALSVQKTGEFAYCIRHTKLPCLFSIALPMLRSDSIVHEYLNLKTKERVKERKKKCCDREVKVLERL
jgi:hypothetical protein